MKGYKWERKLTMEDRKEIVNLYLEGYAVLKIAEHFNIHHATIYYYVKDVKHLRKKQKPIGTPIYGKAKEPSKELKKSTRGKAINKPTYIAKLPPKGLMYKDYLRIDKERKLKKDMERLMKKNK